MKTFLDQSEPIKAREAELLLLPGVSFRLTLAKIVTVSKAAALIITIQNPLWT